MPFDIDQVKKTNPKPGINIVKEADGAYMRISQDPRVYETTSLHQKNVEKCHHYVQSWYSKGPLQISMNTVTRGPKRILGATDIPPSQSLD